MTRQHYTLLAKLIADVHSLPNDGSANAFFNSGLLSILSSDNPDFEPNKFIKEVEKQGGHFPVLAP